MKNKIACEILTISVVLMIITSGIAVGANTTYNIDSEKDNYPQMQPFENHFKPNPTFDHILIIEVYYKTYLPKTYEKYQEFVRVHNPTDSSINIGGWKITDYGKREGTIKFPEWANISAGENIYIANNATAFYELMLVRADFEYGVDSDSTPNMERSGSLWLANTGDEVILKDGKDNVIDVVIYGASTYSGVGWIDVPIEKVDERGIILERDRNETTGQYEDTDSAADWNDYRIYVVGQSHSPYETFNFKGTVTVFTSPDTSFKVISNAIDNANESIYLNVYQFHNFYLMDHLLDE